MIPALNVSTAVAVSVVVFCKYNALAWALDNPDVLDVKYELYMLFRYKKDMGDYKNSFSIII